MALAVPGQARPKCDVLQENRMLSLPSGSEVKEGMGMGEACLRDQRIGERKLLLVRRQTEDAMTYPVPSATAFSTEVSPAEDLSNRSHNHPCACSSTWQEQVIPCVADVSVAQPLACMDCAPIPRVSDRDAGYRRALKGLRFAAPRRWIRRR